MSDQKKSQKRQFKMKIDPKDEGGNYSNIATVLSSENEFLIDFGMFLPGSEQIRVGSRVILSPRTAKQLMIALQNNVRNYENKYGEIKLQQVAQGMGHGPEIAQ